MHSPAVVPCQGQGLSLPVTCEDCAALWRTSPLTGTAAQEHCSCLSHPHISHSHISHSHLSHLSVMPVTPYLSCQHLSHHTCHTMPVTPTSLIPISVIPHLSYHSCRNNTSHRQSTPVTPHLVTPYFSHTLLLQYTFHTPICHNNPHLSQHTSLSQICHITIL